MTRTLHGQCHCGGVRVTLETALADADIAGWECPCGFCRRHGSMTISDPAGKLTITHASRLKPYLFATHSIEFLLCEACGTYVGAFLSDEAGARYGVLNIHGTPLEGLAAKPQSRPMRPAGAAPLTRAERIARCTPAAFVEVLP